MAATAQVNSPFGVLETLLNSGSVDRAITYSNELLKSNGANPEFLVLRGRCFYLNGCTEMARKHFMEALRQDPDYSKAKDFVKLLRSLERTKEEGNKAFTSGNTVEAIECYTLALSLDPNNKQYNAVILANRAAAYMRQNEYIKALQDLNVSISYTPDYIKAYMRRANVYMQMENYERALKDYNFVKEKDPSYPEIENSIRLAHLEIKKSKRKDYYKILGVDSSASEAQIKKAYRKKALKWHPDKQNGTQEERDHAEKMFKDIGEAYGVLSDPQQKRRYDMGMDLEENEGCDPSEMFNMFFGGDPFTSSRNFNFRTRFA